MISPTIHRSKFRLWMSFVIVIVAACAETDPDTLLRQAADARAEGDTATAGIYLRNALQASPNNVDARLQLGLLSLEIGDFAGAESDIRRAAELGAPSEKTQAPLAEAMLRQGKFQQVIDENNPSDAVPAGERAQLLVYLGIARSELGDTAAAMELFESALAIDSTLADAHAEIARMHVTSGEYELANQRIERTLEIDPDHVSALLLKGGRELREQRFGEAEATFAALSATQEYRTRHTFYRLAIGQYVESLLAQNKLEEAATATDTLLRADQGIEARFLSARVTAYQGETEEAIRSLLQLREAADFPPADALLGFLYATTGRLNQAERFLRRAISANANDELSRRLLAEVRLAQNEPEEAIDILRPGLAADAGKQAEFLALAARANLQAGDPQSALDLFRRGMAIEPDNVAMRLQVAAVYLYAGEIDEAITLLEAVPNTGEDNVTAKYLTVLAHLQNDELEQALAVAESAIESHSDEAWPHGLVGTVHEAAGDYDSARGAFEAATQIDRNDPAPYLNLARIDLTEGKADDARRHLQRILEFDETNVQAMMALADLELAPPDIDRSAARRWAQRAQDARPSAVAPGIMLASLMIDDNDIDGALALTEDLIRVAPEIAEVHNLRGAALLKDGDFRGAQSSFNQALNLNPDQPGYHLNLARAQAQRNDTSAALDQITTAHQLDPDVELPFDLLAALQIDTQHQRATEQLLDSLDDSDTNSSNKAFLEGALRTSEGRFAEAAEAYARAYESRPDRSVAMRAFAAADRAGSENPAGLLESWVRDNPGDMDGQFVLAAALHQAGDHAGAIAQYEALLQRDTSAPALNNLAWLYHLEGDTRALETAERAFGLAGNDTAVMDTFGWISVESGDLERGISVLETAAVRSAEPIIQYHLAAAYAKAGRNADAQRVLSKLVGSGQSFEYSAEAQTLLESLRD